MSGMDEKTELEVEYPVQVVRGVDAVRVRPVRVADGVVSYPVLVSVEPPDEAEVLSDEELGLPARL